MSCDDPLERREDGLGRDASLPPIDQAPTDPVHTVETRIMSPRTVSFAILLAWGTPETRLVAQATSMSSVDSAGVHGDLYSFVPATSEDGRFVAFMSLSTNLVSGDNNAAYDVFVHDSLTGATTRVSVDSAGTEGNADSGTPVVSANGTVVAFFSNATNLVPGDTNGFGDIFVHDTSTGNTFIASVDSAGIQGNATSGSSSGISISADGRFVAFDSDATNLVAGDSNSRIDVFVHDLVTGTTIRSSVDSAGGEGNNFSLNPSISADGRFVAFESSASNLVSGDTNNSYDVFVRDLQNGTTVRASVDSSGVQGSLHSLNASISGDGRFVAFESFAGNLVAGDANGAIDIFVHDLSSGATTRVSVDSGGGEANGNSFRPSLSKAGDSVAFQSNASNLVGGDANRRTDIFLRQLATGSTTRVNTDSAGHQANLDSFDAAISDDGRFVTYWSNATNLVLGDTNGFPDAYLHGPYLTLEATPRTVAAGTNLSFTTWRGLPSGLTLLAVVGVNGTPSFFNVGLSSFDVSGIWSLTSLVPAGLAGNVLAFRCFGIDPAGKVGVTNSAEVVFQ